MNTRYHSRSPPRGVWLWCLRRSLTAAGIVVFMLTIDGAVHAAPEGASGGSIASNVDGSARLRAEHVAATTAGEPSAAQHGQVSPTNIHPTWLWAGLQLIPSPEWTFEEHGTFFGLRWQLMPILYSYGIDARLSPWRSLLAEPIVRHSGSVELFVASTYTFRQSEHDSHFTLRGGLRAYFPIVQRGEYLSWSLGAAARRRDEWGAAVEAGIYTFFGVLGLLVEHAPIGPEQTTTITLQLRYF